MPEFFLRAVRRLAALALLWPLLQPSASAQALPDGPPPRIGVVTMTPGEEYWARFGHNAIVVDDPARGLRISYNFGYFDFDQPGFFVNFLRGHMRYRLVAMTLEDDLRSYAEEGRGATLQWLDLEPGQASAVRDHLAWNALPENAEYRYDYFSDNCSTRVRDVLDRALEGELSRQLSGRSHGLTYRMESLRLGAGVPWMALGMHAALGPSADRPLSIRDEAFVPQRLADALAEARSTTGQSLVRDTVMLLPDRLGLERAAPPALRTAFAGTGIALALALAMLLRPRAGRIPRRIGAALAGTVWLACGVAGLVLLGLWGFTDHRAAFGNENWLLLNPLCLLLLAALPALARGRRTFAFLRHTARLVLACSALALFLRFLPFRVQDNGDFIALLAPVHAVLAWRLSQWISHPPTNEGLPDPKD